MRYLVVEHSPVGYVLPCCGEYRSPDGFDILSRIQARERRYYGRRCPWWYGRIAARACLLDHHDL